MSRRPGDPDPFERFTDDEIAAVVARAKLQQEQAPAEFRAKTIAYYEAELARRSERVTA